MAQLLQLDKESCTAANLVNLRKKDKDITAILTTASHVTVYAYTEEAWERCDVEGTLFLVERSSAPYYAILVTNRLSLDNMFQAITSSFRMQLIDPYLMFMSSEGCKLGKKLHTGQVYGIWFHSDTERQQATVTIEAMINRAKEREKAAATAPVTAAEPTPIPAPAPASVQTPADTSASAASLMAMLHIGGDKGSRASAPAAVAKAPVPPPAVPRATATGDCASEPSTGATSALLSALGLAPAAPVPTLASTASLAVGGAQNALLTPDSLGWSSQGSVPKARSTQPQQRSAPGRVASPATTATAPAQPGNGSGPPRPQPAQIDREELRQTLLALLDDDRSALHSS
ncbi:unnamed protein product [Chrysoparadoxa australica]